MILLALEFNFAIWWSFIEKDVSLDIYEAFEEIEKVLFYLEFWNQKALTLLSSSRSWSVWKTAPKLSDIFSRTMRLSNRKEFFKIFGGAENNRHHVSSTVFLKPHHFTMCSRKRSVITKLTMSIKWNHGKKSTTRWP